MESAIIRMMCPNLKCRRILSVPAAARGRTVRCRGCGVNVRVPEAVQPKPHNVPDPEDVVG